MLRSSIILNKLTNAGYSFFTGVPCSIQTTLFNSLNKYVNVQYIPATTEGEAISIALGAQLAGQKPVVLCQNTALGDMILPLITARKMRTPLLLLLSWRSVGSLDADDLLGKITEPLLNLLEIPYEIISSHTKEEEVTKIIKKILIAEKNKRSFVILIQPNTFETVSTKENQCLMNILPSENHTMVYPEKKLNKNMKSRHEIIKWLTVNREKNIIYLSTEGNSTKELFSLKDSFHNLYLCPLGYASSIGLGIALNTSKKVIILDGDGSIIMRLHNISTVGFCRPTNFIHILFNNQTYETTGGQPSVSQSINFHHMIQGASYKTFQICSDFENFKKAFKRSLIEEGPHFLYAEVKPSNTSFSGVTKTPSFYAQRFKRYLNNDKN